jgi:decaprenyl-phosphate phosphoribosyltransferase
MKNILLLLRPYEYVKNLFIFLPLFFAFRITNLELLTNTLIAFVAFSLAASGNYIFNDCYDLDEDRLHPRKKDRPLASGVVDKRTALFIMVILLAAGGGLMTVCSFEAAGILGLYVLMNVAYSVYLRHIAILDVTIIALGFVLRLYVGAAVTGITLTMWIIVITFLLALFMALAKRRDDVLLFLDTGRKHRKVIDGYNIRFLDGAMTIMASVVIVSYILYTTSSYAIEKMHSGNLYFTAIFVILGILRYLQISLVENNGGSPTQIILKDRFIQITIIAWILSFSWIMYR